MRQLSTDKKIRLLYAIAETYPTHRADIRALFGKYLPAAGIRSDLLTCRDSNSNNVDFEWSGGGLILGGQRGGQFRRRLQMFFHIVKNLLTFPVDQYDALQVRDMPVIAAMAIVMGSFRGFRVFYWMSYPMPEGQIQLAKERKLTSGFMKFLYPFVSGHLGKFLLYHFVMPRVGHVFVQSDVMKSEMVEKGVSAEKMTPVPMGVDLEIVRAHCFAQMDDPRLKKNHVLVYLGILERARKIWVLFDMLRIVRQAHPDTVLILAGDTPDLDHRNWLLSEVKRLGLEDAVIWTGWLDVSQAWDYVRSSDIALSPYPRGHLLDSASPTKVAEYMALGIPVVANDQPDQAFVLDQSGAGVSVEYTAENFAAQVIKLIESPELRKEMSEAGPRWVSSNRSYSSISPGVAEVYRRIV